MKKPKRRAIKGILLPLMPEDEKAVNIGYNQACDEWEAWLKETMSSAKIAETVNEHFHTSLYSNDQTYDEVFGEGMCEQESKGIAKAISQMIRGEG